jgi:uncharacterized protein YjiK
MLRQPHGHVPDGNSNASSSADSRSWRRLRRALLVLLAAPALVALRLADFSSDTIEWALPEFPEPSGVVYHPDRKSLFVVGDEGDIGEVSLDGKLLRKVHLGGDLEAITLDPKTGLLYVAREGHEILFEVRPENFKLVRRFTIDRSWKGDPDFLRRGGDGVEGLVYVPDDADPEGGRLWVVNQFDPPVLVRLAIALRTSKDKFQTARIDRAIAVEGAPLSEVTWDPATREFLVVSALWKRVEVLDRDGHHERSVRIPGFMPEGVARLPDGRFVIAQDSGGLIVWKPESDPFRADAPAATSDGVDRRNADAVTRPVAGDAAVGNSAAGHPEARGAIQGR